MKRYCKLILIFYFCQSPDRTNQHPALCNGFSGCPGIFGVSHAALIEGAYMQPEDLTVRNYPNR